MPDRPVWVDIGTAEPGTIAPTVRAPEPDVAVGLHILDGVRQRERARLHRSVKALQHPGARGIHLVGVRDRTGHGTTDHVDVGQPGSDASRVHLVAGAHLHRDRHRRASRHLQPSAKGHLGGNCLALRRRNIGATLDADPDVEALQQVTVVHPDPSGTKGSHDRMA